MSAVDREFRRELTRRVREVVHASPEMRAEWQRRYWPAWVRRWMRLVVGVPAFVAGTVIMPIAVCFAMLVPHVTRVFPEAQEIPAPVPDWTMAQLTVTHAFLLLLGLSNGSGLFCARQELATRAYAPLHDRQHLRDSLKSWLGNCAFCLWVFAPTYIGFARLQGAARWQWPAIAAGVLLQYWLCLSLATIYTSFVANSAWRRLTVGLLGVSSLISAMAAVFGGYMPVPIQQTIAMAILATPLGWVHGAIAFGVVGGHWWGWLFLVPVAAASAYAAWWLRRGYAIGDVLISSTGEATPVFEYGLANDPSEVLPTGAPSSATADHRLQADRTADESVRKRILSGEALAPVDWSRLAFVERFVGRGLSARQRTLIEFAYGGRLTWTRGWWIYAGLALATAAVLLLLRLMLPELRQEGFITALPLLFVLPLIEAAAGMKAGDKHERRIYSLYPIGLSEFVTAAARMYWLRMILWLPILVIVSLAIASFSRHFAAALLVTLLIGLVIPRVWLGIFFRGILSEGPDFSWRRLMALLLLTIPGTSTFLLIVSIHWGITAALVGLTAVSGWLAARYFDWLYLRGGMDLGMPTIPRANHVAAWLSGP